MTHLKHPASALRLAALAALTGALIGCASSGPTAAGGGQQGQGPARLIGGHSLDVFIGAYDVNRDGVVTRAEYDSVHDSQFRSGDTNGNGTLSEAEYVAEFEARFKGQMQRDGRPMSQDMQAQVMKQTHVRFGIIDANHDGAITREEARANADAAFRRWDANGDGVVTNADQRSK